jgi:hypothetical protein
MHRSRGSPRPTTSTGDSSTIAGTAQEAADVHVNHREIEELCRFPGATIEQLIECENRILRLDQVTPELEGLQRSISVPDAAPPIVFPTKIGLRRYTAPDLKWSD